jgi:hypothetical protein
MDYLLYFSSGERVLDAATARDVCVGFCSVGAGDLGGDCATRLTVGAGGLRGDCEIWVTVGIPAFWRCGSTAGRGTLPIKTESTMGVTGVAIGLETTSPLVDGVYDLVRDGLGWNISVGSVEGIGEAEGNPGTPF